MKWTDVQGIGMALADTKPGVDPLAVRFTDLMDWVMALPGFDDEVKRCNEKILEAIQQVWIAERDRGGFPFPDEMIFRPIFKGRNVVFQGQRDQGVGFLSA